MVSCFVLYPFKFAVLHTKNIYSCAHEDLKWPKYTKKFLSAVCLAALWMGEQTNAVLDLFSEFICIIQALFTSC